MKYFSFLFLFFFFYKKVGFDISSNLLEMSKLIFCEKTKQKISLIFCHLLKSIAKDCMDCVLYV